MQVGRKIGFFMGSGEEAEGVVAPEADFVAADAINDTAEDFGLVKKGAGGTVVADVF